MKGWGGGGRGQIDRPLRKEYPQKALLGLKLYLLRQNYCHLMSLQNPELRKGNHSKEKKLLGALTFSMFALFHIKTPHRA